MNKREQLEQYFAQCRRAKSQIDRDLGRQACINGDSVRDGMSNDWYEGFAEEHDRRLKNVRN